MCRDRAEAGKPAVEGWSPEQRARWGCGNVDGGVRCVTVDPGPGALRLGGEKWKSMGSRGALGGHIDWCGGRGVPGARVPEEGSVEVQARSPGRLMGWDVEGRQGREEVGRKTQGERRPEMGAGRGWTCTSLSDSSDSRKLCRNV